HHTRHKADGGETSVKGCVLLCWYHHQVMIHQRGWTLVVNPGGTTTAWNKDKTKVLHSHGPPAPPGKVPLSAGSDVVAFCSERHPASGRWRGPCRRSRGTGDPGGVPRVPPQ